MLALILSCGGSPEPLIYSINKIEPDFVYFLCSKESESEAVNIISDMNYPQDKFSIKIVENHESMDESFARSREIIKEIEDDYEDIHVDFTGGTKPMVSGLVLAAIRENCSYSYVGSENSLSRGKNGLGVVKNGFELIKEQKDPYDVFAVMEFEKGMDFFNRYQFNAAKTNFEEANKKLESQNLKELSALYLDIVEVYDKWDKFNNKIGKKTLHNIFLKIKNIIDNSPYIKKYLESEHPNFLNQFNSNIEFLKFKLSRKGVIKSGDIPYYLADLLNNAQRRIEETKFDDAVARLYRSIELIAQLKLVEYELIDEHVLESNAQFKIRKSDLSNLYNSDVDDFVNSIGGYSNYGRTISVPLKRSYELLDILGCELANEYLNDEDISNNISSRNGSILAHGLNAIDEKKAVELYSQVLDYSKKAFPDVVKYMQMAEFPRFE